MNPAPSSPDAPILLASRTAQVDREVCAAAAGLLLPHAPAGFTLLAVGGYGRRHLFPHSDVDLLLLWESERMAYERKDAIRTFLQRLWDSGLRVSHSVRTPQECAEPHEDNVELSVSLLDWRYLAGDRALYARLEERIIAPARDFFDVTVFRTTNLEDLRATLPAHQLLHSHFLALFVRRQDAGTDLAFANHFPRRTPHP